MKSPGLGETGALRTEGGLGVSGRLPSVLRSLCRRAGQRALWCLFASSICRIFVTRGKCGKRHPGVADARALIEQLPEDHRASPVWRHITTQLEQSAAGMEVVDLGIALRLALLLEGLEYQTQSGTRARKAPAAMSDRGEFTHR
jgi:hypothetical protein